MKPLIRPVTKDDVIEFKGEQYNDSFRGMVVEYDGRVIGIAGVLHGIPLQAFSSMSDEIRRYPKTLILAAREFRKILAMYDGFPIYALASKNERNASGYLKYVGFEHYCGDMYRWVTQ